jgi:hypothetical protein
MIEDREVCAYFKGERVELPEDQIFLLPIPTDSNVRDFTPEHRSP